ncbi:NAD-binding protein [Streptomyces sp. NBC_01537]|uniref:NAD-binding protein n=1 Tax=Streptomyces sp. NBC_01537 TaxID=2903896 RepID=UPI00386A4C08
MVVCGDDALAYRLAYELAQVYGERVTLVVPAARGERGTEFAELTRPQGVVVMQAPVPDEVALREAGVVGAHALALAYGDDQSNIHAALRARRLNPDVRLVVRMYNRKLGRHLEELLERAAATRSPGLRPYELDASATVLSDADTAAPALVAAAVVGSGKVVQADGLLLRAAERPLGSKADETGRAALCTLALLSDSAAEPRGEDAGARLLPDDDAVQEAAGVHGRVVLEAITRRPGPPARRLRRMRGGLPLRELISPHLRYAIAGLVAVQLLLAVLTWQVTGGPLVHAGYLSVLDVLNINDPAVDDPPGRQILQLLSGVTGMALLPVLFAVVLETLGAFRTASALRVPPRRLSGHVVLLGLGKVGSRVLDRLCELGVDVVCVEQDPQARGVAQARARRVPVVIGDVTQEGVLEAAKVGRAQALLALTSSDSTNLEAALYAREIRPELRVVMRLFDDDFAVTVYRALRDSHPQATTRSRSVSSLVAPAFAGAMMGRQILGAIPVERQVLLFAAVEVRGHAELEGRTIGQAFCPGEWRVLALDLADPDHRRPDLAANPDHGGLPREPELAWELHPGYLLQPEDRVVLAATRHGLARLLQSTAPPHEARPPSLQ